MVCVNRVGEGKCGGGKDVWEEAVMMRWHIISMKNINIIISYCNIYYIT